MYVHGNNIVRACAVYQKILNQWQSVSETVQDVCLIVRDLFSKSDIIKMFTKHTHIS